MTQFVSFAESIREVLGVIVRSDVLHAKWLNTLSYLENCGARKIAACEHPTLVKEEMLKHAAEEFRHAYHLKRQIEKIAKPIQDYSMICILGGIASWNYLKTLDLQASRYLSKTVGLSKSQVKEASYLLVTYAIELRAGELYHIYDEELRKMRSKVVVKSIVLEEQEHLNEMIEGLHQMPSGFVHAEHVCAFESRLCANWIKSIKERLKDEGKNKG